MCKNNCNRSSASKDCNNLGPFVATDINCINSKIGNGGENQGGSIIPFSSGRQTVVENILGNRLASLIGFGSAVDLVPLANNTINLTGLLSEAFTVPRDGNITAISASYNALAGQVESGSVTIRAQIFLAPVGSNTFTGTSASVDLVPSITEPIPVGLLVFASATISPVPVTAGDRLLMVLYISSVPGETAVDIILGNASAGINIV
ncbi:BclB C-terminal domain-containing protein [Lysinibacillus sp. AC-3]|uniref:exosporium glycoprotein BclB-related protein n=1 Tax=unclassified Lysinibacillus TaxID=2636778 RepID=UPI0009C85C37|nr:MULTISPECIES: exosporium glycoprotein BclB-related protein [unclassified Lysinibacillus]SKC13818.1 BclB C-terminal domain-containing protein [Lysinibacillus sp. AC-3]